MEWLQYDLADFNQATGLVTELSSRHGRVDLLVNGAASFKSDQDVLRNPAELAKVISDNLATTIWCSHLSFPLLRAGRGAQVVNIASTDGVVASAGQAVEVGVAHDTIYAASKGGVVALTRALAMAWAPHGIRVNAICPTITRTAMTYELLSQPGKESELAGAIPLGRICEPADVAAAVLALIPLGMTTGHILTVDGGYLCL